jgi:outer membrane protein OmpA-like peptidoglycan-associated protein
MKKILLIAVSLFITAPLFAESADQGSGTLGQYPRAEISVTPASGPQTNPSEVDFPKVKTSDDEKMARKFSWWPSDAKPAPYKDPNRSGFWWWPDQPGEARPWGNQGFIYVRKLIFDYKSSEGEMKPSLIIKRILKNVKVYFDFDQSELRDDAIDALSKAVFTLERNPQADLLITGNADTRGTEQYNQKLGERRAAAVKEYIVSRGISESRIRILSRGKMDALAPVNDIVGMQKDRNAQFMVAEVEEVMLPASQASLYEDKEKVIEEKQEIEGEVRVGFKEYVIQKGDTLWGIAKREYGDGNQWRRIYNFNRDVISNPDRPRKGVKIRIPIE